MYSDRVSIVLRHSERFWQVHKCTRQCVIELTMPLPVFAILVVVGLSVGLGLWTCFRIWLNLNILISKKKKHASEERVANIWQTMTAPAKGEYWCPLKASLRVQVSTFSPLWNADSGYEYWVSKALEHHLIPVIF